MSWPRVSGPERTEEARPSGPGPSRQVAVALRYGPREAAPRLVAKGRGQVARAILRLAAEHGVPVEEDPDLAMLLEKLGLYQEIPPELYQVIAEILAFLYRANQDYSSGPNARPLTTD